MPSMFEALLPYIYSKGDSAKRTLRELVDDPMGAIRRNVAAMGEDSGRHLQDMETAAGRGVLGSIPAQRQAAQARTDQVAQDVAMNAVMPLATVWHGSPHKFSKFDSSKIGTGEGAQAYGHGLYLAESPDVASSYRASVTAGRGNAFGIADGDPVKGIATLIAARGKAGEAMARKGYEGKVADMDAAVAKARAAVDELSSLYKVDLPDDTIARMLDWDKPLSEAQRVPLSQAALDQFESGLSGSSGRHLYNEVAFNFKMAGSKTPERDAADWLREQGVPGIRYMDAGSRRVGKGTSNYVVFPGEEGALRILERNGRAVE